MFCIRGSRMSQTSPASVCSTIRWTVNIHRNGTKGFKEKIALRIPEKINKYQTHARLFFCVHEVSSRRMMARHDWASNRVVLHRGIKERTSAAPDILTGRSKDRHHYWAARTIATTLQQQYDCGASIQAKPNLQLQLQLLCNSSKASIIHIHTSHSIYCVYTAR